jgi:hypothetical protein
MHIPASTVAHAFRNARTQRYFQRTRSPLHSRPPAGEVLNQAGLKGHYEGVNHRGEAIILETTRALAAGEVIDLRDSIVLNRDFYR